jgi:carbonic anhydrase/acetyltransferase-like protein (isoleucine patch superfamily)
MKTTRIPRWRRGLLLGCLGFALAAATRAAVLDATGFTYTAQITFNGYTQSAKLTNFPALVTLSSNITGFSYVQFKSAGAGDLRFADASSNELNYEVDPWNANGVSSVWVQAPLLTNGTVIRAYWGQTGLTAPAYTTNGATWNDGNFVGVWHMQTNYATDSTDHGYNAASIDNPAAVTAATGVIGAGQAYTVAGAGGRTPVGNVQVTNQTLSAWVEVPNGANSGIFMAKDDGQTIFWNQGSVLRFETTPYGGDATVNVSSAGGYGNWIHFAATVNGTTQSIYTNGILAAAWTKTAPTPTTATWDLGGGPFARPLNGGLDECRVENVARPAAWIWACWKNQSAPSQFEAIGAVTTLAPSLVVNSPTATAVTTTAASLGATVPSADGVPVTSWGVFWGTSPSPTGNGQSVTGSSTAPFSFSLPVAGLIPGTAYYFQAWASNSVSGTRYSPNGLFYTQPNPATGLIVAPAAGFRLNLSWNPSATASGYLVVIQPGTAVTAAPQANQSYNASAILGQGSDLGGGQYVVYAGSGTNVTVQGLLPYTAYYAAVYAYAGSGNVISYAPSAATGGYMPASFVALKAVQVDPTILLSNYTSLGEWNTNGNFDHWTTTNVSGAAVSGGLLTGTSSGGDPQLALLNLTNGPDLDLGFNDYIDIRLQVPAAFAGNALLYYGVTNTRGISSSRVFTILNSNIASDGVFHVYRVFIGPQAGWRGNLTDLRFDPLGAAVADGQAFAIDYIRVGDLAGDVYLPSYTANVPAPGNNDSANNQPVMDMQSKHFRVVWDNWSITNFPAYWSTNMPHGTLRNFEEVWKSHVWNLGWPEPTRPWGTHTGTKYKVNVTTFYGGYWTGGDSTSMPWVNITPDGLRVDPPTWVPPHEFTHACQMTACTNGPQTVDGQFWENNANYCREQWIYYYSALYPNQSGLDPNYANMSHFWLAHGRDYYLCWPFWLYLDENPDGLPGLGSTNSAFLTPTLWETEPSGEYLWSTLARLVPSLSIQDFIGYMARRNVLWDYSHQTALQNAYNAGDAEIAQRWTYAELRQRPDDPSWWQTPLEMAPQQTGYKIHKLVPQGTGPGRLVTVNFHGLPNAARGADWRASFVVVSDAGAARYSSLWNAGSNSVTLAANENTLYLVVAGTPTPPFLAESIDDSVQPYQSSSPKARFPYEVQIFGAVPFESSNGSTAGLVQVSNGGGWRATTATVDATAYVGPNARVLGSAQVRNNARILDYAVVEGSAKVLSNAMVSGHALVRDNAIVTGYAKVRDYAMVINNSVVQDYARVLEHGQVTGGATNRDWATIKGSASTWYDPGTSVGAYSGGDSVLDGDFSTCQLVTNGFQFGFEEYNPGPLQWITNRVAPRRLYAAYEFDAPDDSLAKDLLGVTDGYLEGNPAWIASDGSRAGFMAFNGSNYVRLSKSLSDSPEITLAAWIKWSGGVSNQPVWYFGSATNACMYLTPNDGTGHAKFVIRNGGPDQTLAAAALPVGVWTHVALTLSNSATARLYVNGALAASGAITITPDALNAGNTNTAAQYNYLARGQSNSLPFFQGALDSVRVYTGALMDSEVAALVPPPAPNVAGTLYVDLRPTNVGASFWTNAGTLANFTKVGAPAYTNNVAGTSVPGVWFDGVSAAYQGPKSVFDIDGSSDRSIEVWAYNPSLQDEETTVSLGYRGTTRADLGFNFGSDATWGAATLDNDDVSWGAAAPSSKAWHYLVFTYSNSVVQIYVDGLLNNTKTLGGPLATAANQPINLGCQRASASGPRGQFFSGYINAVRIHGGTLSAAQVAANDKFGPWLAPPGNSTIQIAPVANRAVAAGVPLSITVAATDPNLPPLPLSFSLLGYPNGANINPSNGVFTWRPSVTQANTTNLVTVQAADNRTPSLTATQNFQITVNPVAQPTLGGIVLTNGQFIFQVFGDYGPDYSIQASTNLADWTTVFTTNQPALPFTWAATINSQPPAMFYRVTIGP